MSNEQFKVKFGLAVGDTVTTIDATTGNIVTTGDLDIKGGDITNSTGAIQIATTSNGNITLAPNGTGNVALTLSNGGNLTNTRNYVLGNIRQTAAAAAGDIWGFNTGTTSPYRGISLDNYATSTTTTGKRTGLVMRNYGAPPRNTIIGEVARGTNPSSPLAPFSGISLLELTGGGYYGGGSDGWTSNTAAGRTGVISLFTTENWSTTNTGTGFTVAVSPTGSYAGQTQTMLNFTMDTSQIISATPSFIDKPVAFGGTGANMLDISTTGINVGGQQVIINNNQTSGNSYLNMFAGSASGRIGWDGTEFFFEEPIQINGSSSGYSKFSAPATGSNLSYVLPGSGGAANTVLTNDGSGNLSWALPGGGGSTFGNVSIGVDTDQTISTTSGDLILQTAAGVNAGTMTFTAGTNGNITLAPNGTGNLALTFNNGGNLTNNRNYVSGNIRQTAAASAGDIWGFGTGTTTPYRGISLDNYATATTTTGKRTGIVMRNYGAPPRNTIIGEVSRGNNPSSPLAPFAGISLMEITGGGYYGGSSDGWTSSSSAGRAGSISLYTTEAWNTTNTGTGLNVSISATGANAGTVQTVLDVNSNNANIYSNNTNINSTSTTNIYSNTTTINNSAGKNFVKVSEIGTRVTLETTQNRAVSGGDYATASWNTYRSTDGINYTPTQANDVIGEFKFNGNSNTGTSPGVPGAPAANFYVQATENWSNTANGATINFAAIRTGTTTSQTVFSGNPNSFAVIGDTVNINGYSGSTFNRVSINSGSAQFNVPVVLAGSTSGSVTVQAPAVAGSQTYTLPTDYPVADNYRLVSTTAGVMSWQPAASTTLTTASVTEGATYTPAVGVSTYIDLTINAGSGTTVIDLVNLTATSTIGQQHYIMAHNLTGSSTQVHVINSRISSNVLISHSVPNTQEKRTLFLITIVGNYAAGSALSDI